MNRTLWQMASVIALVAFALSDLACDDETKDTDEWTYGGGGDSGTFVPSCEPLAAETIVSGGEFSFVARINSLTTLDGETFYASGDGRLYKVSRSTGVVERIPSVDGSDEHIETQDEVVVRSGSKFDRIPKNGDAPTTFRADPTQSVYWVTAPDFITIGDDLVFRQYSRGSGDGHPIDIVRYSAATGQITPIFFSADETFHDQITITPEAAYLTTFATERRDDPRWLRINLATGFAEEFGLDSGWDYRPEGVAHGHLYLARSGPAGWEFGRTSLNGGPFEVLATNALGVIVAPHERGVVYVMNGDRLWWLPTGSSEPQFLGCMRGNNEPLAVIGDEVFIGTEHNDEYGIVVARIPGGENG